MTWVVCSLSVNWQLFYKLRQGSCNSGMVDPKCLYIISCLVWHVLHQFPNEILDYTSQCIALACQTDRNGFVSSLGLTQCVCKIYSCSGHLWQFKSSSHHWLFTDLGCCNVQWWQINVNYYNYLLEEIW